MSDTTPQPAPVVTEHKPPIIAPMIVSLIVLAYFGGLCVSAFTLKDQPTLTGLVEVVKNLAIMVVGYWLGSSNTAATKTVAQKL